jgi:NAD(P)H-hydrate epimerase
MNLSDLQEFAETGVIRADRMRAVEGNAIALGLSALQMMESAGAALAATVLEYRPSRVLVLCGRGNNGGDGMAAARGRLYLSLADGTVACFSLTVNAAALRPKGGDTWFDWQRWG